MVDLIINIFLLKILTPNSKNKSIEKVWHLFEFKECVPIIYVRITASNQRNHVCKHDKCAYPTDDLCLKESLKKYLGYICWCI